MLELVEEDDRWRSLDLGPLAERAAHAVLHAVKRAPDRHEISLLACDDARIAALNAGFRGREAATNVLSWPAFASDVPLPPAGSDDPLFLGDVALAYETCAREAVEAGLPLADHAAHLIVHGCLHLLGYDHGDDGEALRMETLETKILATLGVANPYTDQDGA